MYNKSRSHSARDRISPAYVPGQLSLAILSWINEMSFTELRIWAVDAKHTARCTVCFGVISVVSQCELVGG